MQRMMQYGFPEVVLEPGAEQSVTVQLKGAFRPQRLLMFGHMKEIRGRFWIKRSHLPLLSRDDVINSYSRIYRCRRGRKIWFRKGRTTVEYRGTDKHAPFTRTYLPSSVIYKPTDPLEYIELRNLFCNKEPQMPTTGGVTALAFGPMVFGNGLATATATATVSMAMLLQNVGDICVRVHAAVTGPGNDE